jgi:hypothetical protein
VQIEELASRVRRTSNFSDARLEPLALTQGQRQRLLNTPGLIFYRNVCSRRRPGAASRYSRKRTFECPIDRETSPCGCVQQSGFSSEDRLEP